MAGNSSFLKSTTTQAWLAQFDPVDQPIAIELLRSMKLVSRESFTSQLRKLLLNRLEEVRAPIGLYVEREIKIHNKSPNRLFKECRGKVRRAYGVGPEPVKPTRRYDANVGSEGIVAQIVSELCREHPNKFFNHPGPDKIRKHRIRRFILVTDFIGSGGRVRSYLESAWRVRSVRSWWSARATKGMLFEAVTYAATPKGLAAVESHPSCPKVYMVVSCPTIETVFPDGRVSQLCLKYSKNLKGRPIGFDDVGALIAFAHGVPNNAPAILYNKSPLWLPLFPSRVTSSSAIEFPNSRDVDEIRSNLLLMRQKRLADAGVFKTPKLYKLSTLLVLAALSHPPRTNEVVSRKTGLSIMEVDSAIKLAMNNGWVNADYRLSEFGKAELEQARRVPESKPKSIEKTPSFFYPKALRAP